MLRTDSGHILWDRRLSTAACPPVYLGSMCTAVLISRDPATPPPPALGLIYEGVNASTGKEIARPAVTSILKGVRLPSSIKIIKLIGLVSAIPAGNRKMDNLFLQCNIWPCADRGRVWASPWPWAPCWRTGWWGSPADRSSRHSENPLCKIVDLFF